MTIAIVAVLVAIFLAILFPAFMRGVVIIVALLAAMALFKSQGM